MTRPLRRCSPRADSSRAALTAAASLLLLAAVVTALAGEAPAPARPDFTGTYADPALSAGRNAGDCATGFIAGIGVGARTRVLTGEGTVVIADAQARSVRLVQLNADPPASLPATRQGYSTGRWDRTTLVVETTGLQSGRAVVERFRRLGNGAQIESVIDGRAALADGPYPLRNLEASCNLPAMAADSARRSAVATALAASRPPLEGSWRISAPVLELKTAARTRPPLRAAARKLYEQHQTQLAGTNAIGSACRVTEEPRAGWQSPGLDIVLGADTIFVGYAPWRRALFIPLGERFEGLTGGRLGRWRAHWVKDELVLEGEGFDAASPLDAAGLPHSAQLRIVQHLLLKSNGTLQLRTQFIDEATFLHSWERTDTYRRQAAAPEIDPGC